MCPLPPPLFACCSPDDDRVWYFEGNGAKPLVFLPFIVSTGPLLDGVRAVAVADADGDGDIDVVAVAVLSGAVTLWENNGQEVFTARQLGNVIGATTVAVADMDKDGA